MTNKCSFFLKEELAKDLAASKPDGIKVVLKPEDFIITVRKQNQAKKLQFALEFNNFWINP